MTTIKCEYCGKEITANNYKKHIIRHENNPDSFKESKYKVTHEGLNCQYCNKLCKNNNSLRNHERLCKENPNHQDSNFKSYSNKGHVAWNKGLTRLDDDRVARNGESLRQYYKLHPSKNIGRKLSEDHKQKISETILQKSSQGDWHTSLAHNMHYMYKGEDLHGTWELAYAQFLDQNNIEWKRNKIRFSYYFEGKIHYYCPDFYLVKENTYIEIKGLKTIKDDAKWSQFPKNEKLIVLFYQDLKDLGINIKK